MIEKKKIIIKGRKVQNIGYRPFLLDVADSELLPYFNAKNNKEVDKDGNEIVEVFVGGPEGQVDNFIEFIKDENNRPENADVESVKVVDEDYKGNIRTTESFSRWLSNNQLYKMVAIGSTMLEKQDETIREIRDISGRIDQNREETVSEIRLLRDDLKSYFDERLIRLELEVAQIKAKVCV